MRRSARSRTVRENDVWGVKDPCNERRRRMGGSRTWSHCRQYFNRLMLSSLRAALIPPASRKTVCHLLRCATCWLSCASACCVNVEAGGSVGRSGCELVDERGVGVRLCVMASRCDEDAEKKLTSELIVRPRGV